MDSLQWVDQTYTQKHKAEDPKTLRAMYFPNLRMYATHGDTSQRKSPMDAALAFFLRFGRRAGISLLIYTLSYVPIIGRFVLPAASYYTFNKAVGPVPATLIFGTGIFLPRRYLVRFLQSYFSSRSLMRELVCIHFIVVQIRSVPDTTCTLLAPSCLISKHPFYSDGRFRAYMLIQVSSSNHTSLGFASIKHKSVCGSMIGKAFSSASVWAFTSFSRFLF